MRSADKAPASDDAAAAVALSALPGMTHVRLSLLLRRHDAPRALAVVRGTVRDDVFADHMGDKASTWRPRWISALDKTGPGEWLERCRALGVGVTLRGDTDYPECLALDPAAPSVLFHRGEMGALDGRRVGIVGTRSATLTGRRVATEMGAELAARDVRVVSGLARGIDACAHRGALTGESAVPIGVVASGLDVVYPPEHHDLWRDVGERGLLLSEKPPGTGPVANAFPERNRILAALCEVVVVVESRARGGSLLTAREALARDIAVMAVPGSLASRASEGTNLLLRDGVAAPVLDAGDVLIALGLDTRRARRRGFDPRPPLSGEERELWTMIGGDAVTLEELTLRGGGDLIATALALGRMEASGWVTRVGGWFEAVPPGRSV